MQTAQVICLSLLDEVPCRLRGNRDAEPLVSIAAAAHGRRFAQGYSVAMLVEESRILEVTTFGTLQRHRANWIGIRCC